MASKDEKKDEKKLITVYKQNGKSMEVNEDHLPYLEELKLSRTKPKTTK